MQPQWKALTKNEFLNEILLLLWLSSWALDSLLSWQMSPHVTSVAERQIFIPTLSRVLGNSVILGSCSKLQIHFYNPSTDRFKCFECFLAHASFPISFIAFLFCLGSSLGVWWPTCLLWPGPSLASQEAGVKPSFVTQSPSYSSLLCGVNNRI